MNIILLSGGSGKRLWPLSNDIRSKQFIKILKKEDGTYESMLQRVYSQIKQVDEMANVIIATSEVQVSEIYNQLGTDINISIEPCRRDTFPAIALASSYLADIMNIDPEEPVVVCPVDPFVEKDYFLALKELSIQADKGEANLVLMGIEPTYPSEKYGYIIPESEEHISAVRTFKEKPTTSVAKKYISQGALWNGGVFAYKLKYVLNMAHELIDFCNYNDLFTKYETLTKISFDYAVVEKENKIQVQRFSGQWKDIGTWNTLTETIKDTIIGKGITDDTCDDVYIVNELNIPILAMGLQNIIIAASPDGILVTDKNKSSFIKPYVDNLEQPMMFVERSWGNYKVLDIESENILKKIVLYPGRSIDLHCYKYKMWVVIEGDGNILHDGIEQKIRAGDVLTINADNKYTVIANTKLELIEVQFRKNLPENDR